MTVTLELKPPLDEKLRELATASGLTVEAYLARLIERSVPTERHDAAAMLLEAWAEEDATVDGAEIARRHEEWAAFRKALNEGRSSNRPLFP